MIILSSLPDYIPDNGHMEIYAFKTCIRKHEIGRLIAQMQYRTSGNVMQITIFCIRYKFRRRGIGRQMVDKLKEYASQNGIKHIIVVPGPCDEYNEEKDLSREAQMKIYKKLGFVFPDAKTASIHSVEGTLEIN